MVSHLAMVLAVQLEESSPMKVWNGPDETRLIHHSNATKKQKCWCHVPSFILLVKLIWLSTIRLWLENLTMAEQYLVPAVFMCFHLRKLGWFPTKEALMIMNLAGLFISSKSQPYLPEINPSIGDFVAANFDERWWAGIVLRKDSETDDLIKLMTPWPPYYIHIAY